jgi:hypothetical protein
LGGRQAAASRDLTSSAPGILSVLFDEDSFQRVFLSVVAEIPNGNDRRTPACRAVRSPIDAAPIDQQHSPVTVPDHQ